MTWCMLGKDAGKSKEGSLCDTQFSHLYDEDEDCNTNLWDVWGGKGNMGQSTPESPMV